MMLMMSMLSSVTSSPEVPVPQLLFEEIEGEVGYLSDKLGLFTPDEDVSSMFPLADALLVGSQPINAKVGSELLGGCCGRGAPSEAPRDTEDEVEGEEGEDDEEGGRSKLAEDPLDLGMMTPTVSRILAREIVSG